MIFVLGRLRLLNPIENLRLDETILYCLCVNNMQPLPVQSILVGASGAITLMFFFYIHFQFLYFYFDSDKQDWKN
jgi:hypothetical protein